MIGKTLAHYEILKKIGSGGMGDVYLAKDTRLSRQVALKVLPPDLAENPERRGRFEREARAVAALNHPNIVVVHSVEESDGVHFITMEHVHGKTLVELLPPNGFSLDKFFPIAIQLADAVATAHARGITHRDLKPENAMLTDDGRVKILDFGLAKLSRETTIPGISEIQTLASTQEGLVVGTVHYMSPEQAEGKEVDHRTDIFSLGVLFYQLLTGRIPFRGESAAAVVSAILRDQATPLVQTELNVPRDLSRIVQRCLEKDPLRRFQTALDLKNELEDCRQALASGESEVHIGHTERDHSFPLAMLVVTALAAAALGFAIRGLVGTTRSDALPRLASPRQVTTAVGAEAYPSWSPDQSRLAYAALAYGDNWDIWVKQVSGGPPVNLTASYEGADMHPRWSPDGSQIAFSSSRDGGGCFVMPALGGPARKISTFVSAERGHPAWSPDGRELACVADEAALRITNLATGEFRDLPLPELPGDVFDSSWSPDGILFAFIEAPSYNAPATRLWTMRASDGEATALTDGSTNVWGPSFHDDGSLYYVSNAGGAMDLWRQKLRENGEPDGAPQSTTVALGLHGRAVFSPDGSKLAYAKGRIVANLWRVPILDDRPATWEDAFSLTSEQAFIDSVDVCGKTRQLVFTSDRAGSFDLWVMPAGGGELRQLTTDPTSDWAPAWSPDCSEIVFHSDRGGNRDIWLAPLDPGPLRQLTSRPENELDPRWSPDGTKVTFSSGPPPGRTWAVPAEGGEPRVMIEDGDRADDWSPDGRWILYTNASDGNRWRWAVDGSANENLGFESRAARWSGDGGHIFYLSPAEDDIWAYTIADGTTRRLTELRNRPGKMGPYALATDDDHIYFAWRLDESDIWIMNVARD